MTRFSREQAALIAILVFSFATRAYAVDTQPNWYDDFIYLETGKAYILGTEPRLPQNRYWVVNSITIAPAFVLSEMGRWNMEHPPLAKLLLGAAYIVGGYSAARLLSALFGTVSIFFIYLFFSELLNSRRWGLAAALLLSIETLHLGLSRVATIDIYAFAFGTASMYAALLYRRSGEEKYLVCFWILAALAFACKFMIALALLPLAVLTLHRDVKRSLRYMFAGAVAYLSTYLWALRIFSLSQIASAICWSFEYQFLGHRSFGLGVFKLWNYWFGFCPANYVPGDYFTYVIMISYPLWIPASILLPITFYFAIERNAFAEYLICSLGALTLIPCLFLWGYVWYLLPAVVYVVGVHTLVARSLFKKRAPLSVMYLAIIMVCALTFLCWAYPLLIGKGYFAWR